MAAQQMIEAGRQLELSKIPLFFGEPAKDAFTAETWLDRLESARIIGAWDDPNTAIYMNMAFRDSAIKWRDGLKEMGIDTNNWAQLRAAFLRFYAPGATIRSCVANLDLKQGASESVRDFGPRVSRVIHDIRQSAPAYVFPAPANLFAVAIAALPEVIAIPIPDRQAAHRAIVTVGEQRLADLVCIHIFVAGLKPYIRDKCVTRQFASYYEAYTHATQLEHNLADPRKTHHVSSLDQELPEQDSDPEIAEMELQLDALRLRKNKKQPGRRGGPQKGGTQRGGSSAPKRDYSMYKCHYCHIQGHLQQVCRKRLAAGAPMVNQAPAGLRSVSSVDKENGYTPPPPSQPHHGMPAGSPAPPPGSLPDPNQYFNPFQGSVQSITRTPPSHLNWY
jgi:hypothetical protein